MKKVGLKEVIPFVALTAIAIGSLFFPTGEVFADTSKYVTGDITWVLVATALVYLTRTGNARRAPRCRAVTKCRRATLPAVTWPSAACSGRQSPDSRTWRSPAPGSPNGKMPRRVLTLSASQPRHRAVRTTTQARRLAAPRGVATGPPVQGKSDRAVPRCASGDCTGWG